MQIDVADSKPTIGIWTFVFTDIESSCVLWERHAAKMARAVRELETLTRESVESLGGEVVKTTGDGVIAAFLDPTHAVDAAVQIQQQVYEANWAQSIELKVRIALHTGVAEHRNGDYYGQALNRAARVLSLANGGQILITDATRTLMMNQGADGSRLKFVGTHPLKGLSQPEDLFRVEQEGLAQQFDSLATNAATVNNVPVQLSSFVDRSDLLRRAEAGLERSALMTLVGGAGYGKTRLAIQLAAESKHGKDGTCFVNLVPATDSPRAIQSICEALGYRDSGQMEPAEGLARLVGDRSILLILDNCEHVLEAIAHCVGRLQARCPRLKIVATSREPLGAPGERTLRITPLSVPGRSAKITADDVLNSEAGRLFIERAAPITSFELTDANAPLVAEICQRLDGIPFAIEMAAAKLRAMSLKQVSERLSDRFRLLTGGNRWGAERQQTLKSLIDWSYRLLNDTEQSLFRRLSVFPAGWTLELAERLFRLAKETGTPTINDEDVVELLTSLVDKSLVEFDGVGRYRMLETVREYAGEELRLQGEQEHEEMLFQLTMLGFVAEVKQRGRGIEAPMWLDRLESEHENIRAALDGFLASAHGPMNALRMTRLMHDFWLHRGYLAEAKDFIGQVLQRPCPVGGEALRADVLAGAGNLALRSGLLTEARRYFDEELAARKRLEDQSAHVALLNTGMVDLEAGRLTEARQRCQEALRLAEIEDDRACMAAALGNLGILNRLEGNLEDGRLLIEKAQEASASLGDQFNVCNWTLELAVVALEERRVDEAERLCRDVRTLCLSLGDRWLGAYALETAAELAVARGDWPLAASLSATASSLRQSTHAAELPVEKARNSRRRKLCEDILGDQAAVHYTQGSAAPWMEQLSRGL